jgi:hypothetical protein
MSSSVLDRSRTRARPSDWKVVVRGAPPAEPPDAVELDAPIEPKRPFRYVPTTRATAPSAVLTAPASTTFRDLGRLLLMVAGLAAAVVAAMGLLVNQDTDAPIIPFLSSPARITAYERTTPENVRFLIGSGYNQTAAVPGALIMGWQPGQSDAALRMTMGNPNSDPIIETMSADGTTIQEIRYPEAWPGVDVVIRSTPTGWASNVIVAPGVDPSTVVMEYVGATSLTLDARGQLHIQGPGGEWVDGVPESWQDGPTGRTPIDSSFVLFGGGKFGFNVGGYDTGSPLVIDPPATPAN